MRPTTPRGLDRRALVRDLRRAATPAEQALWLLLRDRRLRGLKVRRQFPIDHVVADFCCYDLRLVVELDGEVHDGKRQRDHDENRDAYLRSRGFEILRLPNAVVLEQPEAALERIVAAARRRGWIGA